MDNDMIIPSEDGNRRWVYNTMIKKGKKLDI